MIDPDILFVTHRVPYPPDKGDRIRTYNILKFLSSRARIHLAALSDEPVDSRARDVLSQFCQQIAIVPLSKFRWVNALTSLVAGRTISEGAFRSAQLQKTIQQWASTTHFQAAFASASSVARYLRPLDLKAGVKVVDIVDVDSQKWLDYASHSSVPKSWLYRCEGRRLRALEQDITSWADGVTLVSEAEARLFRENCLSPAVQSVTNGVDLDYFHPGPVSGEHGCVFVGAFDYKPNLEGACWFVHNVWPELIVRFPNCTLSLVGRNPAKAVRELSAFPGVKVVGTVADVRPYLAEAAVVVAPLLIARGLQNKILEAMAAGKAVVASRRALAGFASQADLPAIGVETVSEWVHSISELLENSERRQALGQAGRTFAEQHHNWSDCLESLSQMMKLQPKLVGASP